ncbi:8-oxo-dGTP pyrophosphatase MutT (NUDIX family) [Actinokineospora baliensis]|uniref:NUDIX domain-containing protein n=1 Tax=Actinokineospora baliensis TaxID=547056 RepID=UPI001959E24E|nr:NUDIX hydrolase [Actinokineospora baliensis]MBM7774101.1 8-oxo-dGTP pyrophosphatase MutT (NUDIX family) [Actinokineospora baliensis]
MSPAEYVASLPRKRMAAGVVFRDRDGRVLWVEPTYKPNWEVPGGVVEAGESPWEAAGRELMEELGLLAGRVGRLLVVDHVHPHDDRPEGMAFLFDGGVLVQADMEGVNLADGEIRSVRFMTVDEARSRVKPVLAGRVAAALDAVRMGSTALCEHGVQINGA